MIIITWLILFGLIILSYFTKIIPLWLPILLYASVVIIKTEEKRGNYRDWKRKNKRDEEWAIEKIANDMAEKGLTFSGERIKKESKAKEDFEFERKKEKRKFAVDIVNTLFLR